MGCKGLSAYNLTCLILQVFILILHLPAVFPNVMCVFFIEHIANCIILLVGKSKISFGLSSNVFHFAPKIFPFQYKKTLQEYYTEKNAV